MTASARQHHFDVLKGIAIFMVVMGHVITFCVRGLDRATLFKFIGEIHMPLFFFISGWFTFRLKPDGLLKRPAITARAIQLLLPMVVVSSLWVFYFPHSGLETPFDSTFKGLWFAESKNGYWFTLCLFQMIVIYALSLPVLNRIRSVVAGLLYTCAVWAVLILVWAALLDSEWGGFLGMDMLATYWPVFMIGAVASRHRNGFTTLTQSSTATTVALLVGGFALYYVSWFWEFPYGEYFEEFRINSIIARPILHVCLAVIAVAVVRPWVTRSYSTAEASGSQPGAWIRLWTYLGANSLGIYLLHYFFLFPLGSWREALEAMNVGFAPLCAVAAVWSAVIIALVLGLLRIISISKPLQLLLTGKK